MGATTATRMANGNNSDGDGNSNDNDNVIPTTFLRSTPITINSNNKFYI